MDIIGIAKDVVKHEEKIKGIIYSGNKLTVVFLSIAGQTSLSDFDCDGYEPFQLFRLILLLESQVEFAENFYVDCDA